MPHGYHLLHSEIATPGYAVAATATCPNGAEARFASVYFPPDAQAATLATAQACLFRGSCPTYLGGDLNCQLLQPRVGEEDLAASTLAFLADLLLAVAHPSCCTHHGASGGTCIDLVAVPSASAWQWTIQSQWSRHLSDHACLLATAGSRISTAARTLNPATLKALPQAAFDDLRRRYRLLETTFCVPHC